MFFQDDQVLKILDDYATVCPVTMTFEVIRCKATAGLYGYPGSGKGDCEADFELMCSNALKCVFRSLSLVRASFSRSSFFSLSLACLQLHLTTTAHCLTAAFTALLLLLLLCPCRYNKPDTLVAKAAQKLRKDGRKLFENTAEDIFSPPAPKPPKPAPPSAYAALPKAASAKQNRQSTGGGGGGGGGGGSHVSGDFGAGERSTNVNGKGKKRQSEAGGGDKRKSSGGGGGGGGVGAWWVNQPSDFLKSAQAVCFLSSARCWQCDNHCPAAASGGAALCDLLLLCLFVC